MDRPDSVLVRDALSYLLITTLVVLAWIVVGSLVAWWQGWQLATELDLGTRGLR